MTKFLGYIKKGASVEDLYDIVDQGFFDVLNILDQTKQDLQYQVGGKSFPDSVVTTESFYLYLPRDRDILLNLEPRVYFQKSSAATGNVYWQASYEYANLGEDFISISAQGTSESILGNAASQGLNCAELPLLDLHETSQDCILKVNLSRDGTHAEDTYAASVSFLTFRLLVPRVY